jgi:hypothetical protein
VLVSRWQLALALALALVSRLVLVSQLAQVMQPQLPLELLREQLHQVSLSRPLQQ